MTAEGIREKMNNWRIKRYELAAALGVRPETVSVWLDEGRQWDLLKMDRAIEGIIDARMEVLG